MKKMIMSCMAAVTMELLWNYREPRQLSEE